ncbi:DNA-binding response regulator [Actinomycetota bacterium]|nr:DNA-binding response regulator [Actinomycetota bacterium]
MTDILIIEDNAELANLLGDFLERDKYSYIIAGSGETGLEYLDKQSVQLVLLDIMLPGIDGFTVCQRIRKKQNVPIIILSAKNQKDDKLSGLALGADDYLEKPYDVDLLIAKIGALLRRQSGTLKQSVFDDANLTVDTVARTAIKHNLSGSVSLELSAKEFDLLVFFLENRGEALRKQAILDAVWGADSFSEPSTLTVHIKWLRDKIEVEPGNPQHIKTVWGVGYRYE